jgi:hypothetical protein
MTSIDTAAEPLKTFAAARRLGVSPHTLFKWRSLGCGPVFSKRGRKIVYSIADLEDYEQATRQRASSGARGAVEPIQIYHGQLLVGEIEDYGRRNVMAFKFESSDRVEIGIFPTRLDAMRAVAKPKQCDGAASIDHGRKGARPHDRR